LCQKPRARFRILIGAQMPDPYSHPSSFLAPAQIPLFIVVHRGAFVVAQRPAELTPLASPRHFFGAELRYWRQRRGLSLAQLGSAVYASADLIGKVEKAQRRASGALVNRCEAILNSGGVLPRLHIFAAAERRPSRGPTSADEAAGAASSTPVMVIVPVHDANEISQMLHRAGVPLPAATAVQTAGADDPAGAVVDLGAARARRPDRPYKTVLVARRR
jgi:transcriptional regulator with XRE-family HTH domain